MNSSDIYNLMSKKNNEIIELEKKITKYNDCLKSLEGIYDSAVSSQAQIELGKSTFLSGGYVDGDKTLHNEQFSDIEKKFSDVKLEISSLRAKTSIKITEMNVSLTNLKSEYSKLEIQYKNLLKKEKESGK